MLLLAEILVETPPIRLSHGGEFKRECILLPMIRIWTYHWLLKLELERHGEGYSVEQPRTPGHDFDFQATCIRVKSGPIVTEHNISNTIS